MAMSPGWRASLTAASVLACAAALTAQRSDRNLDHLYRARQWFELRSAVSAIAGASAWRGSSGIRRSGAGRAHAARDRPLQFTVGRRRRRVRAPVATLFAVG